MENLKPFSENINVEMNITRYAKVGDLVNPPTAKLVKPPRVKEAFKFLKDVTNNKYVDKDPKRIAQGMVNASLEIKKWFVTLPDKTQAAKELGNFFNKTGSISKELEIAIAELGPSGSIIMTPNIEKAKMIVRTVTRDTGVKASEKLISKLAAKVIPLLSLGLTVGLIANQVKDLLKSENVQDQQSESNVIPHGNFYHKDVGWY